MLACLFSRKASLPTISTKQTKGVSNVERTSLKGLNVDLKNLDIDITPMNLDQVWVLKSMLMVTQEKWNYAIYEQNSMS